MRDQSEFRLTLDRTLEEVVLPERPERPAGGETPVDPTIDSRATVQALLATPGAKELVGDVPSLADWALYLPTATFSVCHKTGSAKFLDIWDADHFDGFTDMQHCLSQCRAWFSAAGFTSWGAPETKSGRINCYFQAPANGHFVCDVRLLSYGGPATVECLLDNNSFGPLSFNGTILQPHHAQLQAGGHHFRIRQLSGAFFFVSLVVWRVG